MIVKNRKMYQGCTSCQGGGYGAYGNTLLDTAATAIGMPELGNVLETILGVQDPAAVKAQQEAMIRAQQEASQRNLYIALAVGGGALLILGTVLVMRK